MKPIVLINPLESDRGTGMGQAAEGLSLVLPEGSWVGAPGLSRWFRRINRWRPAWLRQVARLLLAQLAPWCVPRGSRMLFSCHHAPLWRTGRHAVIVHDLIALHFPAQSRAQWAYYRYVLPRVVRAATRLVTISETVRTELAGCFPGREPTVLPSCSARFDRPVQTGLSLNERRRRGRLAFVGARYPHKNLGLVLEALARPECADLTLTVTSCTRRLWPGLAELERSGRVQVLEYAESGELDELYASALALVFPSFDEGLGLPPLEAMATGCPVIVADVPALRETCGDAAFYVDPRNPATLAALLARMRSGAADAEIEEQLAAGRRRVDAFRPERLRERWRAFLENWR